MVYIYIIFANVVLMLEYMGNKHTYFENKKKKKKKKGTDLKENSTCCGEFKQTQGKCSLMCTLSTFLLKVNWQYIFKA